MEYDHIIASLIAKSILGELSKEEQSKLNAWRFSSPHHEELYQKYMAKGFFANMSELYKPGEEKELYSSIDRAIHPNRSKIYSLYRWIGTVAACLLAFIAYHYWASEDLQDTQTSFTMADIKPGMQQAVFYSTRGKMEVVDTPDDSMVVKYPLVYPQLQKEEICYPELIVQSDIQFNDINRVVVPRGGEYHLALPDMTYIDLNSESDLSFVSNYADKERKVAFKGEAYFRVSHLTDDQPFVVVTALGTIKVLGTSFNLRCYEGSNLLQLALEEGKVVFQTDNLEQVVVPGQLLIYDGNLGLLEVKNVDTNLYTSWQKGIYSFKQTPLGMIMEDLSRWYNVPISFASDDLKQKTFTGEIRRYDSFIEVAQMFELTKMIRFKVTDSGIMIDKY